MAHSNMLYRLDISTLYFYEPFLFQISLSTITFTVNSQANNHSYKCIYLFQILYSMKLVFFFSIKIHVMVLNKVFYIQI